MAAACFAALTLGSAPPQAGAYPCGESPARTPQLAGVSSDECRVPDSLRRSASSKRSKNRQGSVSALTVFVLAVAGALLIPIGRKGLPQGVDPYGQDRPTYEPKL